MPNHPTMTPEQKTLIEKEAEKIESELVDHSYPSFESINKIHNIRLKRKFIKGAQFALSIANQWIKIEKGLPEKDGEYDVMIVGDNKPQIALLGKFYIDIDRCFFNNIGNRLNVTHHMHRPLPPTQ